MSAKRILAAVLSATAFATGLSTPTAHADPNDHCSTRSGCCKGTGMR